MGESVNAEAQEKADGEWEEEGGYQKISVIPAQEAQRTASHYFSAVHSGLVCPDETSILKVARDPSSGINKLNKNLNQSQRIKAGEKFPCLSELSGNGAASQSS